jgi:hypothetical protein
LSRLGKTDSDESKLSNVVEVRKFYFTSWLEDIRITSDHKYSLAYYQLASFLSFLFIHILIKYTQNTGYQQLKTKNNPQKIFDFL